MSDRILVMREGRQMAILDALGATQEEVLTAAMGQAELRSDRWPHDRRLILRRTSADQIRELVLVLVIVGLVVFFATQVEGYLSGRTFNRITTGVPDRGGRRRRSSARRPDPQHRPVGRVAVGLVGLRRGHHA